MLSGNLLNSPNNLSLAQKTSPVSRPSVVELMILKFVSLQYRQRLSGVAAGNLKLSVKFTSNFSTIVNISALSLAVSKFPTSQISNISHHPKQCLHYAGEI